MKIPVTVFTGFLGSGKTTIILNLIKQLPKNYKAVLLKNEFGNARVDSLLYKESNIKVTEVLNGCLCCILVGKLGNALEEIISKYNPDRIIIETSGSAYPAPIAWEIRKMKAKLKLDAIVTVIDALNFEGYKDTSYTAKLQAETCDYILINKSELADEKKLDRVMDFVYELNPTTPKIKTDKGFINPDIVFGIDTKLFSNLNKKILIDKDHYHKEVQIIEVKTKKSFSDDFIKEFLKSLPAWDFYRIKGIINQKGKTILINYVFGRFELVKLEKGNNRENLISFMGKNFVFHITKLKEKLKLNDNEISLL